MVEINYETELFDSYKRDLYSCTDVQSLRNLVERYRCFSPDLSTVELTGEESFKEFEEGRALERVGTFPGEEWCSKYAPLIFPVYIAWAQFYANKFECPWGVAYFKLCENGSIPGVDSELAKQEIFALIDPKH